jgi:hypothetical protein
MSVVYVLDATKIFHCHGFSSGNCPVKIGSSMKKLRRRVGPVMVREVESDLLLLDTESDRIHQLNTTAGFIWRQCDGDQSPDEIAEMLVAEFAVDSQVAVQDVVDTLGKLQALNLVVEVRADEQGQEQTSGKFAVVQSGDRRHEREETD